MEKKTIGGFIAALRKANGMTQKDLAERLNVSDKTVSRWERDDGAPDLSAIPAIAEIFGVTCDELLRGERRSPADRAETPEATEGSVKGEKERRRLTKAALSRYRDRTYIAMGLSVVGFIAALIGNLAFLRAVLGFLLGAIFFVASLVCQAVFVNRAFLCVEDGGLAPEELSRFKREVVTLARRSVGLTVAFVGFTFPLILMDAFVGLSADNMLLFGLVGAAAFLAVYVVVCWFGGERLLRAGVYTLEGREAAVYRHNHALQKRCFAGLSAALAATLLFHAFGSEMIWSPINLAKGTVFEDYESFVAYMAQDIPYSDLDSAGMAAVPVAPDDTITWYDDNGNEITEEEALTETITDADGKVVCTYIHRNRAVISVSYAPKDGTVLPITTRTAAQWRAGNRLSALITGGYCVLYPAEVLAAVLIYGKKRMK